jgi:hypothetical protein
MMIVGRYLVPDDPNTPYDMLEIVKKVVDEGVVTEIMPDFAKNIICGFARMEGRTVGVSTTTLYLLYFCFFLKSMLQRDLLSDFVLLYFFFIAQNTLFSLIYFLPSFLEPTSHRWWPTTPTTSPAAWTSTPPSKLPASCASWTPSTSPS